LRRHGYDPRFEQGNMPVQRFIKKITINTLRLAKDSNFVNVPSESGHRIPCSNVQAVKTSPEKKRGRGRDASLKVSSRP